jgi:hypothetical protein
VKQKELLEHFQTFPVSSRDQLLRLYFDNDKRKVRLLNDKMNKLRLQRRVRANTEIKPYVYFASPPRVHRRSSRLEHHLACVDFYIWLKEQSEKYGKGGIPQILAYEYTFGARYAKPDLIMKWDNKVWMVEIQRTVVTEAKMRQKIRLYEETFVERKHEVFADKFNVWIVSPKKYDLESKSIYVLQTVMNFPILWS